MRINDRILSAWIDGELSPKKTDEVRRAIESNPKLKFRADQIKNIGETLRETSSKSPVTAERMVSDIRREIRLSKKEKTHSIKVPTRAWASALVCACILTAIFLVPSMLVIKHQRFTQTAIESVDSDFLDASTMVYTDPDARWTVVWVDGVELGF